MELLQEMLIWHCFDLVHAGGPSALPQQARAGGGPKVWGEDVATASGHGAWARTWPAGGSCHV